MTFTIEYIKDKGIIDKLKPRRHKMLGCTSYHLTKRSNFHQIEITGLCYEWNTFRDEYILNVKNKYRFCLFYLSIEPSYLAIKSFIKFTCAVFVSKVQLNR